MEVKQESLVSLTLPQPQLREKGAIVLLEEDLLGFKLSWYRELQGKPSLKSDMHYISRFVKDGFNKKVILVVLYSKAPIFLDANPPQTPPPPPPRPPPKSRFFLKSRLIIEYFFDFLGR